MDDNGVTISFKEIYEELKKATNQLSLLSMRMDKIETRIEDQTKRQNEFSQKVKASLITAAIPVGLGIVYFVAEGGGF